jgi:ABC-type Na+ efflux pump permease subunit
VFLAYQSNKEAKTSPIELVYIQDESGLEGLDFTGFVADLYKRGTKAYDHIRFEAVKDLNANLNEGVSTKTVGLHLTRDASRYLMELWIPENSDIKTSDGEDLVKVLTGGLEQGKLLNSGITIENLMIAKAAIQTNFTNAGDEIESFGEQVTKMLIPMLVCLAIYMMLLLYGQSIGQIVAVEKTSKLMEMLLTTIKPYPIILGKILAMASIAILQTLVWIVAGVLGFIVGDRIALQMAPEYENMVKEIIALLRDSSGGTAFTPLAVILALIVMCLGFLFYSILAGLVASSINKPEDMAQGMALYQMVVVACFLITYMGSVQTEGVLGTMAKITPYIPFTSVFIVPGNLLVGQGSLIQGWGGLAALAVSTFVLVILTGKTYKDKVFHRGESLGARLKRKRAD